MINSLTKDQSARLAEFRDRWTEIGLSTEPADQRRAEHAIVAMYAAVGLKAPKKIVWCGSPLSQGLTRAIVLDKKVRASVWASVWASVGDSVRVSVGDSVRVSVGDSVRVSVGDSVRASVGDSGYGQHDANWLGFYEYFREVCELKSQTEKLVGHIDQAKSAGWYLPHRHICWVSERHNILARDDRGRLHSVTGPAVSFPDGWAIYAVHGVRVPGYIIEKRDQISVQQIDAEANAEIRRVMIGLYGQERFLIDGNAKLLHRDDFGTLYQKEIPGDEPLVMVKVVNSTRGPDGHFKDYFLRVPPNIRTAREAVAWTFGKTEKQYTPVVQT